MQIRYCTGPDCCREGSQDGGVLNEQPQLDAGTPLAHAGGAISTAEEAVLPADVEAAIGTEALLALQVGTFAQPARH